MKRELRASIPEDQYPRNVFFEDGSPISEAVFEEIRACMASAECLLPVAAERSTDDRQSIRRPRAASVPGAETDPGRDGALISTFEPRRVEDQSR